MLVEDVEIKEQINVGLGWKFCVLVLEEGICLHKQLSYLESSKKKKKISYLFFTWVVIVWKYLFRVRLDTTYFC